MHMRGGMLLVLPKPSLLLLPLPSQLPPRAAAARGGNGSAGARVLSCVAADPALLPLLLVARLHQVLRQAQVGWPGLAGGAGHHSVLCRRLACALA